MSQAEERCQRSTGHNLWRIFLILLLVVSLSVLLSDDVMHRCSDFHVNGALQIFYDDDDDDVWADRESQMAVPSGNW